MPSFTDQLGHSITLDYLPQRIVSLVPSQTELLYDLGLTEEVAGITKFCVHPQTWFRSKTRVGGTKAVKMEIIHRLQPDLILANKEENVKEQIDELSAHYPVWVSDITKLSDALAMITAVGEMTGKASGASVIIKKIEEAFSLLSSYTSDRLFRSVDIKQMGPVVASPVSALKTCYLIWRDPYMTIGGDTFINDMLQRCGLENIFNSRQRYPVITIDELRTLNCELLLLSSEPFPFKEKHIAGLQEQLPDTIILLADGEMFSWYGSRLIQAPAYFEKLLAAAGSKQKTGQIKR